jgi:EAL domain-containing protein (putative c-di-GMP-specific phosphodiesterase class I)
MQTWHTEGHDDLKISINISGIQLLQSDLEETIDAILQKTGFDARYLQLELTESTLMQNIELAADRLQHFKAKEIQISIDDFGTGYSSLSYLKRLPINSLKIDQSFIRNVQNDESDKVIVDTIIAMGHSLGLEVVAEGIEQSVQKEYLHHHDCDILQGYLFGKSLDADSFGALLRGELTIDHDNSQSGEEEYAIEQELRKYSKPLKISF